MSRQNSMNVSSLEVTLDNSQIEINPIGNGTKAIEDIKVLLLHGSPSDMEARCIRATIPSTGWSSTTDASGYYTNTVTLSQNINTSFRPLISLIGSTNNTEATDAQKAAYNLCSVYNFPDSANATTMTVKAKTRPTETFYVTVEGLYFT